MYGMWEDYGVMPSLDQCNGHYGNTPAATVNDAGDNTMDIPAMTNIYHYHFSGTEEPFTLGCYGPVNSLEECYALYPQDCGNSEDIKDITVTYVVLESSNYLGIAFTALKI